MARTVDVGINIRAIDSTRRAVQSVRRGFRQIQSDFSSIRAPRISGNMSSGIRKIRGEVMRAAGITRGWMGTMINGSNVMARRTLPRMQGAIRKTATETQAASRKMSKGFGDVNQVLSSSLLTMGLFSVSVTSLGKKLVKSTIELDQYIRGFKVLDGGMKEARTTMQEIIEVSKLPGIQIPAASRGYMNLRAVGISGRFAIQILEEFSNAVAIAGGKSNDLRESIRQLSQTLSIDKIDMENWRVILERLPTMRTAIQKSFGPKAIHTEELNKILEKQGLSAEQAWRKILEKMKFTERADPNTITNAVERLSNTLWHMAANFGSVYAPAVEALLRKLNELAEGFNEMNKPMREFLAFGITSIGMTIALGAGIYGLVKIFGALKSIVRSARNSMRDFYDKPRYGSGDLTPLTGRERSGRVDTGRVRGDVSLRTMLSDYRKRKSMTAQIDPNNITLRDEYEGIQSNAERDAAKSKHYYDTALSKYKEMDEHQERLIRENTKQQLRNGMYNARIDRAIAQETSQYESELVDVSEKIEREMKKVGNRGEYDDMLRMMRDSEDAYAKSYQELFGSERKRMQRGYLKKYSQQMISDISKTETQRMRAELADPETGALHTDVQVTEADVRESLIREGKLRDELIRDLRSFDAAHEKELARQTKGVANSQQELQNLKQRYALAKEKLGVEKSLDRVRGESRDLAHKYFGDAAYQDLVNEHNRRKKGLKLESDLIDEEIRFSSEMVERKNAIGDELHKSERQMRALEQQVSDPKYAGIDTSDMDIHRADRVRSRIAEMKKNREILLKEIKNIRQINKIDPDLDLVKFLESATMHHSREGTYYKTPYGQRIYPASIVDSLIHRQQQAAGLQDQIEAERAKDIRPADVVALEKNTKDLEIALEQYKRRNADARLEVVKQQQKTLDSIEGLGTKKQRKELMGLFSDFGDDTQLPPDLMSKLNSEVRQRVNTMMSEELQKVNQIQTAAQEALRRGDKAELASLLQQRSNIINGLQDRIARVTEHAVEMDKELGLTDEQMARQTYVDERGMTRFVDTDVETDVRGTVTEARKQSKRDMDLMRENTKRTDTLRAKALANLKAINHFGVWAEVAYSGVIALALGGAALALGALAGHFQQLKDSVSRFEKFMDKHLTTVVKWEKQYKNWRISVRNARNEYEATTPAMKTAFKYELEFLENLSKSDIGVTDDQNTRMELLNKILKEGKVALDEYGVAYYEAMARKDATELLKHERLAEAYAEFGKSFKEMETEEKRIGANSILSLITEKGLKELVEYREYQQRMQDEILKIHPIYEANMGGKKTDIKQSGFGLGIYAYLAKKGEYAGLVEVMQQHLKTENKNINLKTFPLGRERLIEIVDLLVKRNKLQKEQTELTQQYQNARTKLDESVDKVVKLDFQFSDLKEWTVGLSGARGELDKLRSSLLNLSMPMQDFQKDAMRHLESIVSLEDTATKQIEKLSEQLRKAQDKYDLSSFIYKHKDAIADVVRLSPKEDVLKILGRQLGDEVIPPAQLDEINRILKAFGGNKGIASLTASITQASVRGEELTVADIVKKINDAEDKVYKDISESRSQRRLSLMQDSQRDIFADIEKGRSLGVQATGIRSYIQTLTAMMDTETDAVERDALRRSIEVANSQYDSIIEQLEVRSQRRKDIQELNIEDATRTRSMASDPFDKILQRVLKSEGGLDTTDRRFGGVSYAGITQKTYGKWRKGKWGLDAPHIVERLAARPDIVEAFYKSYLNEYKTFDMPDFLQYSFGDFAVNAGSKATKIIKEFRGDEPLGQWTKRMEEQASQDPKVAKELIERFHKRRLQHYEHLAKADPEQYAKYLDGWINRNNEVLATALSEGFETYKKKIDETESPFSFGFSPERAAKIGRQIAQVSSQYMNDIRDATGLFKEMRDIEGVFSDDKIKLTGTALKDVREAIQLLVESTREWNTEIGNVDARVLSLTADMISAPKEFRSVISDEAGFLKGLVRPDTKEFGETLEQYKETFSDLEKLRAVKNADIDKDLPKRAKHALDTYGVLKDMPVYQNVISETLKKVDDAFKQIDDGQIEKLQKKLADLKDELTEGITGKNKDHILNYLTSLRLKINDFGTLRCRHPTS